MLSVRNMLPDVYMSIEELQKYASKTSKTLDAQYNRGRKDCIDGYFYSEDARYFMLAENIRLIKGQVINYGLL